MEDRDIIKALECRVKDKCPECPYFHSYPCDKCRNMQTDALDLINRQKAENKKLKDEYRWIDQESDILKADVENLSRMCDEVNAENEKLCAEIDELIVAKDLLFDEAEALIKKAKAEAYKEFAERLKERKYLDETGWSHGEHPYIVEEDDIDDVLEELVGDTDES